IARELTGRTFARVEPSLAQPGVNDDDPLAGIDDDRIIRGGKYVRLTMCRHECGVHFLAVRMGDDIVRQFEPGHAVGHDGDLEAADLVAVPARCLRAGRRRRRARGALAPSGICAAAVVATAPASTLRSVSLVMAFPP